MLKVGAGGGEKLREGAIGELGEPAAPRALKAEEGKCPERQGSSREVREAQAEELEDGIRCELRFPGMMGAGG